MTWQPHQFDTALWDRANVAAAFQLPGVVVNLQDCKCATLRVPYSNVFDYWDFVGGNGTIGTLRTFNLAPLSIPASSTAPSYTLRVSFEDVELIGYRTTTTKALVPQSGLAIEDMESKPISSTLFSASRTFKGISTIFGFIPTLSSVAGTTSWALNILGRTARSFGWARALAVTPNMRVNTCTHNYMHTCDGPDASTVVAVTADNHLAPSATFSGVGVDEMSFAFVLSRPGMLCTVNWPLATAIAAPLYYCQIDPYAFFYAKKQNTHLAPSTTTVTGGAFWPTPIMWLSNGFVFWRGDLKFSFSVSKTQYHSGRLCITHIPSVTDVTIDLANSQPITTKTAVWDISESTDFEFTVPFINSTSYAYMGTSIGTLSVVVDAPLIAPSTVSSSIDMIVSVQADANFEFACPVDRTWELAPFTGNTFTFQSGIDYAEGCMGERLTSVKQLITRTLPYTGFNTGATTFQVPYWSSPNPGVWSPTGIISAFSPAASYYSAAYLYWRGGTRVSARTVVPATTTVNGTIRNHVLNTPAVTETQNGNLHAIVPYFKPNSRTLVLAQATNGQITSIPTSNYNVPYYGFTFLGAADDSQLGFWLGTPPLMLHALSQETTYPPGLNGYNTWQNNEYIRFLTAVPPGSGTAAVPHYVAPPAALAVQPAAGILSYNPRIRHSVSGMLGPFPPPPAYAQLETTDPTPEPVQVQDN
jgi:hypothetical protein